MNNDERVAPVPGERGYRLVLRLYPRAFRERYEDELVACFRRDRVRPRFRGATGAVRFWALTITDAIRTAVDARRRDADEVPAQKREITMETLFRDVRFALRATWRSGKVAALAALTLALGIGASTAISSVTKSVLLDPLPYPDSERLALIWSQISSSDFARFPISGPELNDLRTRSEQFEELASIWTTIGAVVAHGEPEMVRLGLVTWNFPSLLGVEPVLGRTFEPSEEGNFSDSILISESLFRRRLGGDESILGKSLRIDGGWGFPGGDFTVVGVVPASFRLVLPSDAGVATNLDVWVPFGNDLRAEPRALYYLRTVGRLRPGATMEQAQEEVRAIGQQVQAEFAEYQTSGRGFSAVSLKADAVGRARPVILALLVGTGFLLLVTCANVANLLLSRVAERREEMLLRSALGASGRQITAQLFAESLILAVVGGIGGVLLGCVALRPLLALAPGSLPRPDEITVDPSILLVGFLLSLACGLLFGLAPALASSRQSRFNGIYTGLRSASPGGGFGGRARSTLVVAELALAFVLSVGASLSFRTLIEIENVDLGFHADGVLTMELTLPRQRYGTAVELENLTREMERRVRGIPGVIAAGAINQLPLSDLPNWSSPYRLRSSAPDAPAPEADGRVVSSGYLRAIGATLLEGRFIEPRDDAYNRHVVVVDELLASRAWPGESALTKELELEVRTEQGFVPVWAEVVGVVRHIRHHDPRLQMREQFFVPFAQGARNQMGLAVRTSDASDPYALVTPIRSALAAIDKDLAVSNVRLLEDYARDARSVERLTTVLAAGFAGMALVLGCLGLYGVMSHAVSSRSREIGVRMALGSTASAIARSVLGKSVALTGAGIALGLAGALGVGRLMEGLLFGVSSNDPMTLGVVPLVLASVAIVASWLPVRRATRVDPVAVLRKE